LLLHSIRNWTFAQTAVGSRLQQHADMAAMVLLTIAFLIDLIINRFESDHDLKLQV